MEQTENILKCWVSIEWLQYKYPYDYSTVGFVDTMKLSFGASAIKIVLEIIQKGTQAKSIIMNDLTVNAEKWFRIKEKVVMRFSENRIQRD